MHFKPVLILLTTKSNENNISFKMVQIKEYALDVSDYAY